MGGIQQSLALIWNFRLQLYFCAKRYVRRPLVSTSTALTAVAWQAAPFAVLLAGRYRDHKIFGDLSGPSGTSLTRVPPFGGFYLRGGRRSSIPHSSALVISINFAIATSERATALLEIASLARLLASRF